MNKKEIQKKSVLFQIKKNVNFGKISVIIFLKMKNFMKIINNKY